MHAFDSDPADDGDKVAYTIVGEKVVALIKSEPLQTHVIFPHFVVSNDPTYFPEPKRFMPERWMKHMEPSVTCPHAGQKIHPFVSLPFGFGRRMCVGRRFAEIELNTILTKIFRKYKVEYNSGELVYKVNSTYIPESPLNFKLTLREE